MPDTAARAIAAATNVPMAEKIWLGAAIAITLPFALFGAHVCLTIVHHIG